MALLSPFSGDGKAEIKVEQKDKKKGHGGIFKFYWPEYEVKDSSTKGMKLIRLLSSDMVNMVMDRQLGSMLTLVNFYVCTVPKRIKWSTTFKEQ